jgi:glycerophosphoryl diester phosphodiesterase
MLCPKAMKVEVVVNLRKQTFIRPTAVEIRFYGGNIPFNSHASFQIALNHDADIVELDVERSEDNKLFVLHPGTERHIIRLNDTIRRYPSDFVARFRLSNEDGGETSEPILRLEEALDFLKGKCIVNLDKFWMNPEAIAKLVRERNMQDQVLLKISLNEKQIKDRIEQITRQHNEAAGKPYPIEMSTGISEFLCGTDIDIHEIIERADEKLYKEKAEKKAKNGSYR